MDELNRCPCCGAELKVSGPEDWHPTYDDPDSGGYPYMASCDCGYSFCNNSYEYDKFLDAANRRADGWIPVSNHPKDSREIIIARWTEGYKRWHKGFYYGEKYYRESTDGRMLEFDATHWMRQPSPPKVQKEES